MANAVPPAGVYHEFLLLLSQTVEEDLVRPVLRGSVLLQHWFGAKARPAADLDFECFMMPAEVIEEAYGYNPYESAVDYGKATCRYAAIGSTYYRWARPAQSPPAVEFQPIEEPRDGNSLWVYGTPGERYIAGWVYHDNNGETGELQIDIAEAATHAEEIGITGIKLVSPRNVEFSCPAYNQETMLAAKLSWLFRGLSPRGNATEDKAKEGGSGQARPQPPQWEGEPKDLFDAHLLLTHGTLDAGEFERVMAAVGTADMLNWNCIETLSDLRTTPMDDDQFANWPEFQQQYADLIPCGPSQMIREVAERLQPLLGSLYAGNELPFLKAIDAARDKPLPYLVYADWLEEHGDSRAAFLRRYAAFIAEAPYDTAELKSLFNTQPAGWLRRVIGTFRRFNTLKGALQPE